jgi:hypothetical protein
MGIVLRILKGLGSRVCPARHEGDETLGFESESGRHLCGIGEGDSTTGSGADIDDPSTAEIGFGGFLNGDGDIVFRPVKSSDDDALLFIH